MKGILLLEVFRVDEAKLPKPRYLVTPFTPHVTLQFNCESEDYRQHLLKTVEVVATEEFYNDRVQGLKVHINDPDISSLCCNKVPHISISKIDEAMFVETGKAYETAPVKKPLEKGLVLKTVVVFQPFSLFKLQHATNGSTTSL